MAELLAWFARPGVSSAFAVAFSLVSLGISARLLMIEWAREKKQKEESHSASLRAYIRRDGDAVYIIINNKGEAAARDIELTLAGQSLPDHDWIHGEKPTVIGPHSEASFLAAPDLGTDLSNLLLVARWQDGTGKQREYETTLTWQPF